MATRKRRSSTRRKTANPKRRRTTTTTAAKRTTSRRRRNPIVAHSSRKRTTSRRRRNPVSGGVISEGLVLGGSGIVIGLAQPIIRPFIQRFIGNSPIASAGVTLATGYGLSFLAGMVGPAKKYQRSLELAGWTLAFTQLASQYVLPLLGGSRVNPPATAGLNGYRRGMNGIAAVSAVPPGVVPAPVAAAPAGNGMNGIAAVPGRFGR